jgi:arylamine N-acetyltransferase
MKAKNDRTLFSVENYLSHVGLTNFKVSDHSIEELTSIIEHHLMTFNYQNSELFEAGKQPIAMRKLSSLEIHPLYENMVANKGGYCFQHLELLHAVLVNLGFKVDRFLAKIVLKNCSQLDLDKAVKIKTHELLNIHLNELSYIVDVGMANQSIRAPLVLKEGLNCIDDDQYRLSKKDSLWSLDTKNKKEEEWFCLYQFFDSPVNFQDITRAHHELLLTEINIPIRDDKLLIGETTKEKRKFVVWLSSSDFGLFKSIKRNSSVEPKTKKFTDFEETYDFAKQKFGLNS